jgi:acyl-CoA synthetase (NDP forming)
MAGDYEVMRAKVERAGVVLAQTLEELGDIVEIALRCGAPGGGTAVLGESGAFKALTLDTCEAIELDLPAITTPAPRRCAPRCPISSRSATRLISPRRGWSIPISTAARSRR